MRNLYNYSLQLWRGEKGFAAATLLITAQLMVAMLSNYAGFLPALVWYSLYVFAFVSTWRATYRVSPKLAASALRIVMMFAAIWSGGRLVFILGIL